MRLSFTERANHSKNPIAKKLFSLMTKKKTNLGLIADITQSNKILELANQLGPEICLLKLHIDILDDFSSEFTQELKQLAAKHDFLIFEDRKFADIGNTVKHQYEGGVYRIADWADIVNAHTLPGPGVIQGLMETGLKKQRGLLLIAEMSSSDNLLSNDYAQKTLAMAKNFDEFVFGFICQRKLSDDPQWIYLTPGVQFNVAGDALGQRYISPEKAIKDNGTDIILVGRGIVQAKDPIAEAKKYREAGWEALNF